VRIVALVAGHTCVMVILSELSDSVWVGRHGQPSGWFVVCWFGLASEALFGGVAIIVAK